MHLIADTSAHDHSLSPAIYIVTDDHAALGFIGVYMAPMMMMPVLIRMPDAEVYAEALSARRGCEPNAQNRQQCDCKLPHGNLHSLALLRENAWPCGTVPFYGKL